MGSIAIQDEVGWLEAQVDEAIRVQQAVRDMAPLLAEIARHMTEVLKAGGQVFFFGNGGSAADAQHWAAELSGRFYRTRPCLPAVALTTNASQVTALANDFGYDEIFAHPLAGMGKKGDMAVGISTSGRSRNVLRAFDVARERGIATVGFTGASGNEMETRSDFLIKIPSQDVARIQEGHEVCGHLICALVERTLFGDEEEGSGR